MRESTAQLMRVNCRLTLLLREMVFIARGLRPVTELVSSAELEEEKRAAEAEANGEVDADIRREKEKEQAKKEEQETPQIALEWCQRHRDGARESAARLLTAYFSALTTHPVGLRGFAAAAIDAYLSGVPAVEHRRRASREFGTWRVADGVCSAPPQTPRFFALFVTTAYVTAEEEGLLPDFTRGRSAATETETATAEMDVDAEAASDPDMFAWPPPLARRRRMRRRMMRRGAADQWLGCESRYARG